jgi:6-phosphogluconolactonase
MLRNGQALATRAPRNSVSVAVLLDRGSLMRAAADRIVALAEQAIRAHGRFMWALAGGSTPAELYSLLASAEYVQRIDWSRVHFFWGDERCVPPEHHDSNYRMAKGTLLDVVRPPDSHVHRMLGEVEPSEAAARYQMELERAFDGAPTDHFPRFDLILLGMGSDGHTASLFPGSAGLAERERWVIANHAVHLVAVPPAAVLTSVRLTLTFPVLNAARNVLFLVAGADKAERLAEVLTSQHPGPPYPAELVQPELGAEWLVDGAAGAKIGDPPSGAHSIEERR